MDILIARGESENEEKIKLRLADCLDYARNRTLENGEEYS